MPSIISANAAKFDIRHALRVVWKSAPGWTVVSVALLFVQSALSLLTLYMMKLIVDAVAQGLVAPSKSVAVERLTLFVALSGTVAVISALCASLSRYVTTSQALAVTDSMFDVIHSKSVEVDLEYYEDSQYYDSLHRALQEAPYRPTRIVGEMTLVGQSLVSLVAIAGLLLSFHWAIGVLLMAAAMPGALVRMRNARLMFAWHRLRTPGERAASYYNWLLTRDSHAKEIRLFDLGALFIRRYRDVRHQLRRDRNKINATRFRSEAAAEVITIAVVYALFGYVGFRALHGFLTVGDLVMCFQAVQRAQSLLGQTLSSLSELYQSNLFLTSVQEFLNVKPRVVEPSDPKPVPRPLRTGVQLDHVSFNYPKSSRRVLDNVSLSIRPGEHVAFVGENGAGKTTLVKLLCRLYDPTDGAIYLDGSDLRELETAALRREISVVFQDYAHYHLTASENIWLGNINLPPDQGRIVAAARKAGADDVIAKLKDGYDTTLGKWFEGGEELSIGEWQKVALARAFLRDAQLVVLDEPSSAMDAKAEYDLFSRFHHLTEGRTAILISHRLSTVRMADTIYVLEHGRIVECGTHDDLMHSSGKYADLFERQAQYYR